MKYEIQKGVKVLKKNVSNAGRGWDEDSGMPSGRGGWSCVLEEGVIYADFERIGAERAFQADSVTDTKAAK